MKSSFSYMLVPFRSTTHCSQLFVIINRFSSSLPTPFTKCIESTPHLLFLGKFSVSPPSDPTSSPSDPTFLLCCFLELNFSFLLQSCEFFTFALFASVTTAVSSATIALPFFVLAESAASLISLVYQPSSFFLCSLVFLERSVKTFQYNNKIMKKNKISRLMKEKETVVYSTKTDHKSKMISKKCCTSLRNNMINIFTENEIQAVISQRKKK